MVQDLSIHSLTSLGDPKVYGSPLSWRENFKQTSPTHLTSRQFFWHQRMRSFSLASQPCRSKRGNFKVKAGWLFRGGGQGLDARIERSENANNDILIFFFQLDLATRVQYALNIEQYEIAQELRTKLTEVEAEVIKQQESKRGLTSKSEVQDKGLHIIRLRADLQKAIESENYTFAAQLRDQISKLETESLAASAKVLAYESAEYNFRLGQKTKHKIFGYRGVICGMDPVCCETSSWMEIAQVEKLSRGSNQPFYQVLVDVRTNPDLLVAYVAEENLLVPEEPDTERFDHPYNSFLFYGVDTAGDFIPVRQLREKYNRPRHEVPYDSQDDDEQRGDD
ncbi:clp protease adapter protein ClpF, chloroplastic isoform X2 [Cucurbita maxima]|uniref:Clp protease adapter protein ClpF, chloroplastic isoform X2 n=1 Tax=Cucurbita maxima TaxID=3661 RepID=A0A6J1KAU5_CUCMA|nr:clp protease adapter protein ClpF, chloroplastic isoform X2 [Cucurbita maxima]